MKTKIFIERDGKTLFKGKILTMPVRESAIVEKSIELFDDNEPCIIHQSFVIKHYADEMLSLFEQNEIIDAEEYKEALFFLDFESLTGITIRKKG